MRRDRLNERFLELGRDLDPSTTPRTDKGIILGNAVRALTGLKAEAAALKQGTFQLLDQIKELKAEKTELRDEKARLKAHREFLQLQLQALPFPGSESYSSPATAAATAVAVTAIQAAAGAAHTTQTGVKSPPAQPQTAADISRVPTMWQWLPPALAVETNGNHSLLRPPVA